MPWHDPTLSTDENGRAKPWSGPTKSYDCDIGIGNNMHLENHG